MHVVSALSVHDAVLYVLPETQVEHARQTASDVDVHAAVMYVDSDVQAWHVWQSDAEVAP